MEEIALFNGMSPAEQFAYWQARPEFLLGKRVLFICEFEKLGSRTDVFGQYATTISSVVVGLGGPHYTTIGATADGNEIRYSEGCFDVVGVAVAHIVDDRAKLYITPSIISRFGPNTTAVLDAAKGNVRTAVADTTIGATVTFCYQKNAESPKEYWTGEVITTYLTKWDVTVLVRCGVRVVRIYTRDLRGSDEFRIIIDGNSHPAITWL